jgi:hypothetical protein
VRTAADTCKRDYDYGGVQDDDYRSGIRARLSILKKPSVKTGFVASWVGVGGPGLGPNGEDEWLQLGYVTFDSGQAQIYYEITLPGKSPAYHTVKEKLSVNDQHLITVLEVGDKPNSWRVWLDNKAVSPVYNLPKSHGKFIPQALAETWNGGTQKCNLYGWEFADVQISSVPGGSWKLGKAGYVWENAHNVITKVSNDTFKARSESSVHRTTAGEPPLLGAVASRRAGTQLTTRGADDPQSAPRRAGELVLRSSLCSTLLGYVVSHPWAPKADGAPGRDVAHKAFGFLRAVGRASGVSEERVDCFSMTRFYKLMRALAATTSQGAALRNALLRDRASIEPPLSLTSACRIR